MGLTCSIGFGVMMALSAGFAEDGPDSPAAMEHAYKWILKYGGGLAFILIIAWPCLALPAGVFSKGETTTDLLKAPCGSLNASCNLIRLCADHCLALTGAALWLLRQG